MQHAGTTDGPPVRLPPLTLFGQWLWLLQSPESLFQLRSTMRARIASPSYACASQHSLFAAKAGAASNRRHIQVTGVAILGCLVCLGRCLDLSVSWRALARSYALRARINAKGHEMRMLQQQAKEESHRVIWRYIRNPPS